MCLNTKLVGSSGLEPPTSRLSGVRSNHLSYEPIFDGRTRSVTVLSGPWLRTGPHGGDERDRTDDPLLAKQVLSQLSYTPVFVSTFCFLKVHYSKRVSLSLHLLTVLVYLQN